MAEKRKIGKIPPPQMLTWGAFHPRP